MQEVQSAVTTAIRWLAAGIRQWRPPARLTLSVCLAITGGGEGDRIDSNVILLTDMLSLSLPVKCKTF